jgi:hypothetical protein
MNEDIFPLTGGIAEETRGALVGTWSTFQGNCGEFSARVCLKEGKGMEEGEEGIEEVVVGLMLSHEEWWK